MRFIAGADHITIERLRTVRWFVECGDDDFLLDGNIVFFREMRAADIPQQFCIRYGGHEWEYRHSALYKIFPFISFGFTN